MLQAVREQAADAVGLLKLELPELPSEIPSIHFTEAQRMMAAATGEEVEGQTDLSPAHERWLGEWARRTVGTDFLFVVGPSGAGKSTLIRLLIREEKPTRGKIFVQGVELGRMKRRQLPRYRRKVGLVFQDFKLLSW